eukprot:m.98583 g.98583  ORF g.98583 m.98583 type:complete len:531 (-) comp9016_c5_seq1:845-2437(-)
MKGNSAKLHSKQHKSPSPSSSHGKKEGSNIANKPKSTTLLVSPGNQKRPAVGTTKTTAITSPTTPLQKSKTSSFKGSLPSSPQLLMMKPTRSILSASPRNVRSAPNTPISGKRPRKSLVRFATTNAIQLHHRAINAQVVPSDPKVIPVGLGMPLCGSPCRGCNKCVVQQKTPTNKKPKLVGFLSPAQSRNIAKVHGFPEKVSVKLQKENHSLRRTRGQVTCTCTKGKCANNCSCAKVGVGCTDGCGCESIGCKNPSGIMYVVDEEAIVRNWIEKGVKTLGENEPSLGVKKEEEEDEEEEDEGEDEEEEDEDEDEGEEENSDVHGEGKGKAHITLRNSNNSTSGLKARVKKRISQMFLTSDNSQALYLPQLEHAIVDPMDEDPFDDTELDINKLTIMLGELGEGTHGENNDEEDIEGGVGKSGDESKKNDEYIDVDAVESSSNLAHMQKGNDLLKALAELELSFASKAYEAGNDVKQKSSINGSDPPATKGDDDSYIEVDVDVDAATESEKEKRKMPINLVDFDLDDELSI